MAGEWHPSIDRVLAVLSDGKPKSYREIVEATGLSDNAVWSALKRCWRKGLIFRSEKPLYEPYKTFKGRAGIRRNLRSYHLYVKAQEGRIYRISIYKLITLKEEKITSFPLCLGEMPRAGLKNGFSERERKKSGNFYLNAPIFL